MPKLSRASLLREAYVNFNQVSEEDYRTLIREAGSQEERDFYYSMYNRMLAKKQEKVIRRKDFVV